MNTNGNGLKEDELEIAKRILREWLDKDQMILLITNHVFKGNLDQFELSPSDQADPASFLISYFGFDLLAEQPVRESLVTSLESRQGHDGLKRLLVKLRGDYDPSNQSNRELAAVRKWEKGGPMALAFTNFFNFPRRFAGERNLDIRPEPRESVQARESPPKLHDYQSALIKEIDDWLQVSANDGTSAMLVLPTGTGKTRVAGEALVNFLSTRDVGEDGQVRDVVLWLAHTRELCEQAYDSIHNLWVCKGPDGRYLDMFRFWSDTDVGELQGVGGCVIAGVQKLHYAITHEEEAIILKNHLSRRLRLIVIDEAHLADNPSYVEVLNFFSNGGGPKGRRWKLLGLSATPFKGNEARDKDLSSMFERRFVVNPSSIEGAQAEGKSVFEWMQQHGYLSGTIRYRPISMPDWHRFRLKPMEEKHVDRFRDLDETALSRLALDRIRNDMIVASVVSAIRDGQQKILLFACSVPHCRILREFLNRNGIAASMVTGGMSKQERSRVISTFKNETVGPVVLINYAILTTGFDDPKIDTVFITRPTWSRVLYHQMIGRGLRGVNNGGNGSCLIIDVKDNYDNFQGSQDIIDYSREGGSWSM